MTALERQLAEALRRLVNLSGHPLFVEPRGLTAWAPGIDDGREAVRAYDRAAQQSDEQRARVAELNAAAAERATK